ncbi:MAG: hypothetical protein LLG01_18520 [Planctomycetaceae bacterium]|nr:hypothetical protein [Planctomycetaceae bacterium]
MALTHWPAKSFRPVAATVALAAVFLSNAAAEEQNADIHIDRAAQQASWPWIVNDGAGNRWDVLPNGSISNGNNSSAYSGAMFLRANGSEFNTGTPGALSKDGRELEVGPWSCGTFNVWRRIYVDAKSGYCRWIDIFENQTNQRQSISLEYRIATNYPMTLCQTSAGNTAVGPQDWAMATGNANTSAAAMLHVFSSPSSKVRPRVTHSSSSNQMRYDFKASIGPGKAFALCFFEMQHKNQGQAAAAIKAFDPAAELRKIPLPLRMLIANMGARVQMIGALALPRDGKNDQVLLANGDQLMGTLLNESYSIETLFGRLDVPADRVLGLACPAREDPQIMMALTDGQVVAGKWLSGPLQLTTVNGSKVSIELDRLASASYRLSDEKGETFPALPAVAVLRDGQRLAFKADGADLTFQTQYGSFKLSPADLTALHLDTPNSGLHRAVLTNGSILSGLLTAKSQTLALELDKTLTVESLLIERMLFSREKPASAPQWQAAVVLRNGDRLFGRIAQDAITVETTSGPMAVAPKDIEQAQFAGDLPDSVQITLHSGTNVSGQLTAAALQFEPASGMKLLLPIAHLRSLSASNEAAGTPPAVNPAGGDDLQTDTPDSVSPPPSRKRPRLPRIRPGTTQPVAAPQLQTTGG